MHRRTWSALALGAVLLVGSVPVAGVASAAAQPIPEDAAVAKVSSGDCDAYLPEGWTMSTDEKSQGADAVSASGREWAGWTMLPINTDMQPYAANYGVEKDFYSADPAKQAMATLRMVARNLKYSTNFSKVGRPVSRGIYKAVRVESPNASGVLVWASKPPRGDGYTLDYYSVFRATLAPKGTSDADLYRLARNALSISCTSEPWPAPEAFPPASVAQVAAGRGGNAGPMSSLWVHDSGSGQNYSIAASELVSARCGAGTGTSVEVAGRGCVTIVRGLNRAAAD